MELTQQSLLDGLMASRRDSWTTFPNDLNGFFPNCWTLEPNLDYTPELAAANPSISGLVSQEELCNLYPFGEFQPFVDAFNSSEFSSFDNKNDIMAMPVLEEYCTRNVENEQVGFPADMTNISNVSLFAGGKSKVKKANGQPSKNLMAERRRRKRLNDRLSLLRSIVPKISKMDRTSILGDTIDYVKELLDKIHKMQEEDMDLNTSQMKLTRNLKELNPNETLVKNPPKFDVERRNQDTQIEVRCTGKPGLLSSTLSTLDALGFDIQQCVISCFNDFSLQASCYETVENQAIMSTEDVEQALFRNAGYGGRCL
ncbi:transcription factor bHLH93-like [Olea europaea subsp. europaea]|uniref:Transcription factor bHLH93-like n=1 Tax=Olea europaea subsp. europaea TaxID=158383 RepID=A0A8S0T6U1_OLEEU|nr:transcription factor bHLH93-like [Olea europaea subsp. europaea]